MTTSQPLSLRSSFEMEEDKDFDEESPQTSGYTRETEGLMGSEYLAWSKPVTDWAGGRISSKKGFRIVMLCLFVLVALLVGAFYHSRPTKTPTPQMNVHTSTDAHPHAVQHQIAKPEGLKIIAFVFYGRPSRVEMLDCYLKQNLVENGGFLDEVQWAVNTNKEEDIKWLDDVVLPSTTSYKKVMIGNTNQGDFGNVWQHVERRHLYIKIDDDVLFIDEHAIPELVDARMKHPDAFIVSANIVNNPLLGWVHYRMGALHPYLPEMTAPSPSAAAEWRASKQPSWTGPKDFRFGLDKPPPFEGHRWLPVRDSSHSIRDTPVAEIQYDAFGTGWNKWAIGAQEHASFLENLEKDQLDLYRTTSKIWDFSGDRLSINFIAVWGDDIVDNSPIAQDDEPAITMDIPKKLGRSSIVASHALVTHFTFGQQTELEQTNLLARYSAYAHEKICPKYPGKPKPGL